jgi:hypothetical protein
MTLWFAVVLIGFIEGLRSLVLWSRIVPWRGFSHCVCKFGVLRRNGYGKYTVGYVV